MNKPPAFQLYASDFDMDTATWDNEEVGIYLRLLLYQWVNGGVPNDLEKMSRIVRCSAKKFIGKWENVSPKFVQKGGGLLVNKRMEEVRKEQEEWRNKQIESGRLGGLKTQEKKRLEPSEPSSNPTPKPSSENQALQSSSSSLPLSKDIKAPLIGREEPDNGAFSDKLKEENRFKETFEKIERLRLVMSANGTFRRASTWAQMKIQLQYHPEAILLALQRVNEFKPKAPEPYADQILLVESQNHNEADHIAKSKILKDSTPTLQEALRGAIHGMSTEMQGLSED